MIKTVLAIRITMALMLEDRASAEQDSYIHSPNYQFGTLSPEMLRLKERAATLIRGCQIPKDRDVSALFSRVCQSYRVNSWELEEAFFEG